MSSFDFIETLARCRFERGEYSFDRSWDDLPEETRVYLRAAARRALEHLGGEEVLRELCAALGGEIGNERDTGRVPSAPSRDQC